MQDANPKRDEIRRFLRRIGAVMIATSPIVAAWFGVLFTPVAGAIFGAAWLSLGLYVGFAYLPFAEWLRRREKSRVRS